MDELLYDIAHNGMSGRSKEYKGAFYINVYNLLVIHTIQANWPVKRVLDIEGIFDKMTFNVAGEKLDLNTIENQKLRSDLGDNRIHFALICGAASCPEIQSYAFMPDALHDQLKYVTAQSLSDPNIVRIDDENKIIYASKVFEWYKVDFGKTNAGVLTFIKDYAQKDIPEDYGLKYMEYDWTVNGH
ncbi:MAG: DUF547 domain-containing protein [Bacteroidetes bacterium]|nr:DUF547 domain-containing protein [Bacteroidota bacterium]